MDGLHARMRLEMAAHRLGDHVMLVDNFEPQSERAGHAVQVEGLHDTHHALRATVPTRARGDGANKRVSASTPHFLLRRRTYRLAKGVLPEPFPLSTSRTADACDLRLYVCVSKHG